MAKEWKQGFTPEQERAYWQEQRERYIAKNDRLMNEPGYCWYDPLAFYRTIFPEGFLQDRWTGEAEGEGYDGKPNAIAIEFTNETRTKKRKRRVKGKEVVEEIEVPVIRRHTVTDDLDGVETLFKRSIAENHMVYMAPVSWFGKRNIAANARFLHAIAIDLDGVDVGHLRDLLKQIRNGHDPSKEKSVSLPQPTFIVNSGRGLHLYYVLDRPIPLVPGVIPFLQALKRALTDVVWTDYTSELGHGRRQYQGIYQGFRMPGTSTRLNGHGAEGKKSRKYEAVAFAYEPDGEPQRVSLDYLVEYTAIRGRERPDELKWLLKTGNRTPIEEAREKWPEWYRRRVVEGGEKGRWTDKRDLYDWWLRKIADDAVVGGRYFSIVALAAFATKCEIPYDDLERDALSLVERLDDISEEPGNRFSSSDVEAALKVYGTEKALNLSRDFISRKTLIRVDPNKRNGRTLEENIAIVNNGRKFKRDVLGEDAYANNGRPKGSGTKSDAIRAYAVEHPEASQREIAAALGVSKTTVNKWLKPGWEDEWDEASRALPAGAYFGEDGRIHMRIVDWDLVIPEFEGLKDGTASRRGGSVEYYLTDDLTDGESDEEERR